MASVPFYLSLFCTIVSDSKVRDEYSFLTMSDLYASTFFYFFQNHINKNGQPIYKIMESDYNKKFIFNISKVAYCLLMENKFVFTRREIEVCFSDFEKIEERFYGFIERIETNLGYHYQFVHLTIMEFCASVFAYNSFSSTEIMLNKKHWNLLPMICGLTNKKESSLLNHLANLTTLKKNEKSSLFDFLATKRWKYIRRLSKQIKSSTVKITVVVQEYSYVVAYWIYRR
nr:uncharacterized protein LOC124810539 isoform X2 [Hydra vulgaris]